MRTRQSLVGVRGLREEPARVPVSFAPNNGVDVVVSPTSGICPRGRLGVVAPGDSAIMTVPDEDTAVLVREALTGLGADTVVDGASIRAVLPVAQVLGPATSAHVRPAGFRPAATGASAVAQLPGDHAEPRPLQRAAGAEDAGEAALGGDHMARVRGS